MANEKISQMPAISSFATGDLLPIVDISEISTSDQNKSVTFGELFRNVLGGTASAPSIAFTGDQNTGLYSPGADQVAISTNGTGRLFVNSVGQVGVGKVAAQLFDAEAAGNAQVRVTTTDTSGTNTGSLIARYTGGGGGTASTIFLRAGDGYTSVGASTNSPLLFVNNETERMRLDTSGRLGLGTSSPGSILDVKFSDSSTTIGGSASVIRVNNGSGAIGGTSGVEFFHGNDTSSNTARLAGVYGRYASFNASGLGGELVFATNTAGDSTIDERMRITSGGLVGIGTTSPSTPLEVAATGLQTDFITLFGNRNTADTEVGILFKDRSADPGGQNAARIYSKRQGTAQNYSLTIATGGSGTLVDRVTVQQSGNVEINAQAATSPFIAKISSTEVARIDSSGRLLVGTSSADTTHFANVGKVFIEDITDAGSSLIQTCWNASDTSQAFHILAKSGGASVGTRGIVAADESLGQLAFEGDDGTNFIRAAVIRAQVDGTPGTNDMPGRLVFSVTADGASSPTEAMRIKNSRIINIANTPVYADNAAAKTGGLVDGDVYRTSTGDLKIVYT